MSQVLRCFSCEVFQVHPAKKTLKWKCKMCNEKQSIKRRYGIGTGKECRIHVQKLNTLRGNIDQSNENIDSSSDDDHVAIVDDEPEVDNKKKKYSGKSKWSHFVSKEESDHEEEPNSTMYLNDVEVVLEAPKKGMKRKLNKSLYNKMSWKRNKKTNGQEKDNKDYMETPEIQANVRGTVESDIKPKPKIKFVAPKLATNVQTSIHKTFKWDDFTIGTVDYDSGVMYLDSQYQQTRLTDQTETEGCIENHGTTANCIKKSSKITKSNSKWGQFLCKDEGVETNVLGMNNGGTSVTTRSNLSADKLQNMFSLCDGIELDDVLYF